MRTESELGRCALKIMKFIIYSLTALLLVGCATKPHSDSPKCEGDWIALELDYPRYIMHSSSWMINTSENLEKKSLIPTIFAPKGTVNIAKGKIVTSSDDWPVIGELGYVTNGDKRGHDGTYVEIGPGLQWIQIDLGSVHEIFAIALWHYYASHVVYKDVIIQVSNDPEFATNVITLLNNDHDNSAGLGKGSDKEYIDTNYGKLIDGQLKKGRYIRLYSAGYILSHPPGNAPYVRDVNHYIEVEVYGR